MFSNTTSSIELVILDPNNARPTSSKLSTLIPNMLLGPSDLQPDLARLSKRSRQQLIISSKLFTHHMNRISKLTDHLEGSQYVTIKRKGRTAIVSLNRPNAMNAISSSLMAQLASALRSIENDPSIACIVIHGEGKAFAAGADLKEMSQLSFQSMLQNDWIAPLDAVGRCRVPIIAAVHGFALGGGCELAMSCDIVLCSKDTTFGQPEVKVGAIPGAGGTQRLIRAVGKSKAMEWILSARHFSAEEAKMHGLVSHVYADKAELMREAIRLAEEISQFSRPLLMMAKEAVNTAENMPLSQGIQFERRLFHSLFSLDDQKEGMEAFAEKRKAKFQDR